MSLRNFHLFNLEEILIKINKAKLREEQGAIIIIIALMMPMIISFLGLSVDVGFAYLQKARLQSVADSEALSCVIKSPCPQNGGDSYPEVNPSHFTVTINNPGDSSLCLLPSQSGCALATVSSTWNTFFIGLFGFRTIQLSATAIAGRNGLTPACIISTAGFSANGNNQVIVKNCDAAIGGILSSTNKAGITITGQGSIAVFNGGNPNQCGTCSPSPKSIPTPIPNLPSSVIPTKNIDGTLLPTLPYTSCKNSACIPAIYTGGMVSLNTATTLQTGNYVFSGGFSNNGNPLNSGVGGVSLFIPGNQVLNLSGTINLTAPSTPGCTAGSGIVISHPYVSSYNALTLNGSSQNLNLNGVINLSADDVTVNGSSANLNITGSLVTHSITLHGNMYPQVSANPCFNFYETIGNPILID